VIGVKIIPLLAVNREVWVDRLDKGGARFEHLNEYSRNVLISDIVLHINTALCLFYHVTGHSRCHGRYHRMQYFSAIVRGHVKRDGLCQEN
jgi:hypothetical protein